MLQSCLLKTFQNENEIIPSDQVNIGLEPKLTNYFIIFFSLCFAGTFERHLEQTDSQQCSPVFRDSWKVKLSYLRSSASAYDPAFIEDNRNPFSEQAD